MTFNINHHPGYWLLAIFLIMTGLGFFGVTIPAIVLGLFALLAGVFILATG